MNDALAVIQNENNMTDEQRAEILGVKADVIQGWKNGKKPNSKDYKLISETFHIPVRNMMTEFDSDIVCEVTEEDIIGRNYLNDVINDKVMLVIGHNLRRLRFENGKTISSVAHATNISYASLLSLEKGKAAKISISGCCRGIAKYYGMPIVDFCNELLKPIGNTYAFAKEERSESFIEKMMRIVNAIYGDIDDSNMYRIDFAELHKALCSLPKTEKDIVFKRFTKQMTLLEVSKELGMRPEKVRQLEAKAFRRLRRPVNSRKIVLTSYEKQREVELENMELSRENAILKKMLKKYGVDIETKKYPQNILMETIIEEAEFSTRTYNCLKRAGYRNLQDIADSNILRLQKVRNLGKYSLDEIVTYMKDNYGVEIPIGEE